MDSIAYLIKQRITTDEIGQQIETDEKQTPIFIEVQSVSRSEFYNAGREGLMPEFVFVTAAVNYSGEDTVDFAGQRFTIYRTYRSGGSDQIELYVQKKTGDGK